MDTDLSISNKYLFTDLELSKWAEKTNNYQGPPLGKIKTENDTYSQLFSNCRASTSRLQFIGRKGIDVLPNYLRWLAIIEPLFKVPDGAIKIKLSDKGQFHFTWRPSSEWNGYERINAMQACLLITEPWGDFFLKRFFEYYDKQTLSFWKCIELVAYEFRKLSFNAEEFRMFTYRFPFGNVLSGVPYFNKDVTEQYLKDSYVAVPINNNGKFPGYFFYKESGNLTDDEKIIQHGYEQLLLVLLSTRYINAKDKNEIAVILPNKDKLKIEEFIHSDACHCVRFFPSLPDEILICGHERIKIVFDTVQQLRDLVEANKGTISNKLASGGIRNQMYPLIRNIIQ